MRTEGDIRRGKGVEIYRNAKGGVVSVPVLAMNATDDWLELSDELIELEQQVVAATTVADTRAAKRAYNAKLLEVVCAYSDKLDPEVVAAEIGGEDLAAAYWRLREVSDPFDSVQRIKQDQAMRQFRDLPEDVITAALKIGLRDTPQLSTLSPSQDNSPVKEASGK